MPTAAELLASACTSGISCLNEKNLLVAIAQGASAGGGGGGGGGGTLSTDGTFAANSDLLYPSQKAAKTYVDAAQAAAIASSNATSDSLYVKKAGDTMTGALLLPNGAVGTPSLSHTADANTGLWYPAADTIAFSTAGAERVRIDSSGNVGIGTVGPSYRLQVTATGVNLFLENTAANARLYIGEGNGVSQYGALGWSLASNYTYLDSQGSRPLVLQSGNEGAGDVGIGTTAPNEILSINGARAALYNALTSSTNFERLDFEWSANVCRIWTEKGGGGGTARDLVLGADATELLRFQTASKIGFFGVAPVVRPPAYTPSNVTTDRSYDANASTLDEIADVLGTLISDLQGLGLLQ